MLTANAHAFNLFRAAVWRKRLALLFCLAAIGYHLRRQLPASRLQVGAVTRGTNIGAPRN
jgi:hypothetical protein